MQQRQQHQLARLLFLSYSHVSFYVAYDVRISWDAVREEKKISCYISKDVSFHIVHISQPFYTFFLLRSVMIHMQEIFSLSHSL